MPVESAAPSSSGRGSHRHRQADATAAHLPEQPPRVHTASMSAGSRSQPFVLEHLSRAFGPNGWQVRRRHMSAPMRPPLPQNTGQESSAWLCNEWQGDSCFDPPASPVSSHSRPHLQADQRKIAAGQWPGIPAWAEQLIKGGRIALSESDSDSASSESDVEGTGFIDTHRGSVPVSDSEEWHSAAPTLGSYQSQLDALPQVAAEGSRGWGRAKASSSRSRQDHSQGAKVTLACLRRSRGLRRRGRRRRRRRAEPPEWEFELGGDSESDSSSWHEDPPSKPPAGVSSPSASAAEPVRKENVQPAIPQGSGQGSQPMGSYQEPAAHQPPMQPMSPQGAFEYSASSNAAPPLGPNPYYPQAAFNSQQQASYPPQPLFQLPQPPLPPYQLPPHLQPPLPPFPEANMDVLKRLYGAVPPYGPQGIHQAMHLPPPPLYHSSAHQLQPPGPWLHTDLTWQQTLLLARPRRSRRGRELQDHGFEALLDANPLYKDPAILWPLPPMAIPGRFMERPPPVPPANDDLIWRNPQVSTLQHPGSQADYV